MGAYLVVRTQIVLTDEEPRARDREAARTGLSVSALIRAAVETVYGVERSADDDLAAMSDAFAAGKDRDIDAVAWVEQRRSGTRLVRDGS